MGTTIKPIETQYKGYRFRSRLEARWAVFFDTMGIEYQYEPEGFDLEGLWYLPDFYLPELDSWIEIKPTKLDPVELNKAKAFNELVSHNYYVLIGQPYNREYSTITPRRDWYSEDPFRDQGFFVCGVCGHIGIGVVSYSSTDEEWIYHCECCDGGECRDAHPNWATWFYKGDICAPINPREDTQLLAAFDAARSARFEFGG